MRPRGEIREALHSVALSLPLDQGLNYRDFAAKACVGFDAAHTTIKNMARAGELDVVKTDRVDWSRRPVAFYGIRRATSASAELARVINEWPTT